MIFFVLAFILFLCWGSFLNVLGHRLMRNQSIFTPRSHCPTCKRTLLWYELIPVASWLALRGRCRTCKAPISYLYPAIELLTALTLTIGLKTLSLHYFGSYFIFFSGLIVTVRTDIEMMLISRFVSLFLVPVGLTLSFFGFLPLSPIASFLGALFGYLFLATTSYIFKFFTGKEGIGQGDFELLAYIGSFTGIIGTWVSLLIGSCIGSVVGLIYMALYKTGRGLKIPFGPFLAIGAMVYVLYNDMIVKLLTTLS